MNAAEWFAVDGMPPERNTGFLIVTIDDQRIAAAFREKLATGLAGQ